MHQKSLVMHLRSLSTTLIFLFSPKSHQTCLKRTHLGIFPPCGSWWWNCSTRTVTTTDKPTIIMVLAKY